MVLGNGGFVVTGFLSFYICRCFIQTKLFYLMKKVLFNCGYLIYKYFGRIFLGFCQKSIS